MISSRTKPLIMLFLVDLFKGTKVCDVMKVLGTLQRGEKYY